MIKNKKYIDIDYSDKKQLGIVITMMVLSIISLISALVGLAASFTGMLVLFDVFFDNTLNNTHEPEDWIVIMSLAVAIMSLVVLMIQFIPFWDGINKFTISITCVLLDILQVIVLFSLAETYLNVEANILAWVIIVFDTITYSSLITIIILALFIIED